MNEVISKFGFMAVNLLLLLALAVSAGASNPRLVANWNRTLAPQQVDYTTYNVKPCKCRQECVANSSCEGVTVTASSCSFTTQHQLLSALQDSDDGAGTYLKPQPCEQPFEVAPGAGCIYVSGTKVNGTEVRTICPEGSSQWSPATDVIYRNLFRYVRQVKGIYAPLHAGVEHANGTWTWLDGHTLSSVVGSSVWGDWDPNCNTVKEICGYTIAYKDQLIDTECTYNALYICSRP